MNEPVAAPGCPVARVLVDVPLAHLDRPFDYLVPAALDDAARPGVRVKVRFAGRDVDGFVVERLDESGHEGRLTPLRRVVSREPVLTPAVAALAEAVAARYAGARSDVLRLAIPPRHARAEQQESPPAAPMETDAAVGRRAWSRYPAGPRFLDHLAAGGSPRAVWTALPAADWTDPLAAAVAATAASGRGAVICVPDRRDVARMAAALTEALGADRHTVLTADLGPAQRYRAFLSVARGASRIVLGTRATAFAPVHDLGLVAIWDDGDDLYAEPRAPYPHTREVLLLRARDEGCALLVGGHARTVESDYLLRSGWAHELAPDRATVRVEMPRVSITGATDIERARDPAAASARLPRSAHDVVRAGLEQGPVLVQTPRLGYAVSLACERCRTPVRCPECTGPLRLPSRDSPPTCGWCGRVQPRWSCPVCSSTALRAPVLGERRTAEELGRAFPDVPVRTSSGDRVLDRVADAPAIVVATPGAEPWAAGGYPCVLLLDTWLTLARADLRAAEEALRRFLNAAALSRPGSEGGRVIAVGPSEDRVLQALVRWDPDGFAARETADREQAHLPPAARVATLTAAGDILECAVAGLALPPGTELLGPVAAQGTEDSRLVVRAPRAHGPALSAALRQMQAGRAAKKLPPVRVQIDPVALG